MFQLLLDGIENCRMIPAVNRGKMCRDCIVKNYLELQALGHG